MQPGLSKVADAASIQDDVPSAGYLQLLRLDRNRLETADVATVEWAVRRAGSMSRRTTDRVQAV